MLRNIIEATTGIPTRSIYKELPMGLLNSDNSTISTDHLLDQGGPLFCKTHELWHADTPGRAIYVVRDGRDACVSFAHFLMEVEGFQADFPRLLANIVESTDYGAWSAHVKRWTDRKAPTAVVHYEDLCHAPHETLRRAFHILSLEDINISSDPPKSFSDLQKFNPHFYRRGGSGSYKDEMPQSLQDRFTQLHGPTLDHVESLRRHHKS